MSGPLWQGSETGVAAAPAEPGASTGHGPGGPGEPFVGAEAGAPLLGAVAVGAATPARLAWRRLRRDRVSMASLVFLACLCVLALAAPLIVAANGHPPNDTSLQYEVTNEFGLPEGPSLSTGFWFGADTFGRDVLSRILYGARISLLIGVVATGIAIVVGVTVGMFAGYFRGPADTLLSRLVDVLLSFPILLLALGLRAVFGASLWIIIGVIAGVTWPYVARVVRGQTLSLREKEFVEAARASGAGNLRIVFGEILPNLRGTVLVYSTLIIPANILFEATLAYLGLGLPPPTATWGQMIAEGQQYYLEAPWLLFFPGAALLATTIAFNLLGDGLRDALDPRALP